MNNIDTVGDNVKAAWVRPGGPAIPDGVKARAWGIDTLFYDATDPLATAKFFEQVRGWGFRPGFTRDPTWGSLGAVDLANAMNKDLIRLESTAKYCTVMADIEALWNKGSGYVLTWLRTWRSLRPTRATIWTTEPNQGGAISDDLVAAINADPNLVVAPQLYFSGMEDAVESRVALDLRDRGIRSDRIRPYYDAEDMPGAYDGIIFDFNKLPATP